MKNLNYKKHINKQSGQTLVTLLFFMIISISITSAVIIVVFNTIVSGGNFEQGTKAYYAAETGIENALLRLLRDPNYTGETLSLNGVTVNVSVNGDVITSVAEYGNSIRKIEVETVYNNNIREVLTWKEID